MQTPGMLQDDSRELSRWLSTHLGARYQLQRNNMQTNQTPEALAEECKRLATIVQTRQFTPGNAGYLELLYAIDRLRDMAASRAKDAERYQMVRRGQRWSVINGIGDELKGEALDAAADAAIAATKRGGA